jgi:hypothetical protein
VLWEVGVRMGWATGCGCKNAIKSRLKTPRYDVHRLGGPKRVMVWQVGVKFRPAMFAADSPKEGYGFGGWC